MPLKWLRKIQLVQNQAARLISGLNRREHITPTLRSLHWLTVVDRIEFKALCLAYRAYHGTGPQYLNSLITRYTPARGLRSLTAGLVTCPSARLLTFGGRRFSVRATALWNSLPVSIRSLPSIMAFRKRIKTCFFEGKAG